MQAQQQYYKSILYKCNPQLLQCPLVKVVSKWIQETDMLEKKILCSNNLENKKIQMAASHKI